MNIVEEQNQLIMKDLFPRLQYGVKVKVSLDFTDFDEVSGRTLGGVCEGDCTLYLIDMNDKHVEVYTPDDCPDDMVGIYDCISEESCCGEIFIDEITPYLRPLSSMTENEEKEFHSLVGYKGDSEDGWTICDNIHTRWGIWIPGIIELVDWLNKHHFDYRGLIGKGLALEAPENMYNF